MLSLFPNALFIEGLITATFLCLPHLQKRKSSSLLDARMAKIYRRQRHSRDGDDSASDDDDEGLSVEQSKASCHWLLCLDYDPLF